MFKRKLDFECAEAYGELDDAENRISFLHSQRDILFDSFYAVALRAEHLRVQAASARLSRLNDLPAWLFH